MKNYQLTIKSFVALSLWALICGIAYAAPAEQFPIDPTVQGPIKVKWKLTNSGGIVLDGDNASGTPLTVQHVKDGNQKGISRHPFFRVIDKHNNKNVQKTKPSIEIVENNGKGVALKMGASKKNWTLVVAPDNKLFLREQTGSLNGLDFVRFYVLTTGFIDESNMSVAAGSEVCPAPWIDATASDVIHRGGTDYQWAVNNICVRSCDDITRLGDMSIPVLQN